jgi:hypothetical protein
VCASGRGYDHHVGVPVLLRAMCRPVPNVPGDLNELVKLGAWGWECDSSGQSAADPALQARLVRFVGDHSRTWPMPTHNELYRLARRLEVLPVCGELRLLLTGERVDPDALGPGIRAAQAYVELLSAEAVVLRTQDHVLSSWEGDLADSLLVSVGGASLRWTWAGLTYEDLTGAYLVNGWSPRGLDVEPLALPSAGRLRELILGINPEGASIRVEWCPYSTLAGEWLSTIRTAAAFAGPDGVLGIA